VVEWGPDKNVWLGKPTVTAKTVKSVKSKRFVVRPGSSEQASIERRFKNIYEAMLREGIVYFPPVMPTPEVWELWKKAKNEEELGEAVQKMRHWARRLHAGADFQADELMEDNVVLAWASLPFIFRPSWNEEILKAKQLWNYPVTNRPRSDDKRVEFFAKSLAGLTLGLAPATATKRLSHWHWPRDWATNTGKNSIMEGRNEQ
jgi:hypothetical protein